MVLEAFDADNTSLTVTHIARRSGLPVPTVYRIVTEMVEFGLLDRGCGREVRVGVRLWEIASVVPHALGLREAAMPFMEDLIIANQQNTHLTVLDGREALVIERLSAHNAVVNYTRAGGRHPLHATTGGLVVLAHADVELQDSFLSSKLRAYTQYTPTDPAEVRRILASIRDHGYVICDGYVSLETLGVGVPVRSPEGDVIAALSIIVPRSGAQPMTHVHALTAATRGITRALTQVPARSQPRPPKFFPAAEIDPNTPPGLPGRAPSRE
jgi:DNA-binding IclR family transcriptional regulator